MSTNLPKVRITLTGPGRGSVFLNDVELPFVTEVTLRSVVGQPNMVSVTLMAGAVDVEGEAEVMMRVRDELTLTLKDRG